MTDQLELANKRIAELQATIAAHVHNAKHWKRRFEQSQTRTPTSVSIVFELDTDVNYNLRREATLRFMQPDALAKRIVEAVVNDKLFKAILDQ